MWTTVSIIALIIFALFLLICLAGAMTLYGKTVNQRDKFAEMYRNGSDAEAPVEYRENRIRTITGD